jgi:uncharacterized protein (DUF433 family)
MEVHFTPETEKKLRDLAAQSGRATDELAEDAMAGYVGPSGQDNTVSVDWSQCPAVESAPGKRSGAWVFRGTRTPVSVVFENLPDMTIDELVEEFGVTREQVQAVLEFVALSSRPTAGPCR